MTATGADLVCQTLADLGVRCVFGLPGTQNVTLFEALRRSSIRTVLASHEAAATFMANGYYRASGRLGVVVTIPGPGFAWALPALAEARLDSAALLLLTGPPARGPGRAFQLQAIAQGAVAAPLVKRVFDVDRPADLAQVLRDAAATALSGEPGPVIVQLADTALAQVPLGAASRTAAAAADPDREPLSRAVAALGAAQRVVIFAGQGAAGAAAAVTALAERRGALVLTTPSGRGVVAEDHPLALAFDFQRGDVAVVNQLLERADLVVALGCKFGHNGTGGFALRLPADRLVHVDADPAVLNANYEARYPVAARVEDVLDAFAAAPRPAGGWPEGAAVEWRRRLHVSGTRAPEPAVHGVPGNNAQEFFRQLRAALPRDAILVLDSGLHQVLARRYFDVLAPRGLLFPSDFQSMGFALPAAIGAKLAAPERAVVALLGDGGFKFSGLELLTAARERLPVTAIVFNDGRLNMIRLQQLQSFGRDAAVDVHNPDFAALAAACGVGYGLVDGDVAAALAATGGGTGILEVRVGDSPAIHMARGGALAREVVRRAMPSAAVRWAKRLLGRGR